MKIEQLYTGCLAQGAYYISSKGEAAIIDPLRETAPYLAYAQKDNSQINYVFETHFHADFVSGHLTLAKETGAKIVFGPTAKTGYDAHIAKDGETFSIGDLTLEVLHTPGHTMESTCYLLKDENGKPVALFSGDTLFIGDVGRPDLAVKSDLTKEDLAGHLFDSLRNKIMPLPDDIIVYPAHGAGSACGKNMSKETSDTLGNQKKFNYALRASMSKEEFIAEVTEGLTAPPAYFPGNVRMNKEGYEDLGTLIEKGLKGFSPEEFEEMVNRTGALVLDTRAPQTFCQGFIPNSINIGIDGGFAPWVGALVPDMLQPIALVAEEGKEEEVMTRLSRVGYDGTIGFLQGGTAAWEAAGKELDQIESISAEELKKRLETDAKQLTIVDVRKESEHESEHLEAGDAQLLNLPLDFINEGMKQLDKAGTYHVHCAGGYRSMIASSILKARGYDHIVDVKGGFNALKESDLPVTAFVCQSTLK